jgi:hypothetical protein
MVNSNRIITKGNAAAGRFGKLGIENREGEKIRSNIIQACAMLSERKNTQASVVRKKVKPMFNAILRE